MSHLLWLKGKGRIKKGLGPLLSKISSEYVSGV
jgi:hypothetical protein